MDVVRPAEPEDLPLLRGIEEAADRLVESVLGGELDPGTDGARRARDPGFLLVTGRPAVGFAQVLEEDGGAHLQQLCVHPDHGRQGLGRALVEACCDEASARGYAEITLTTFRDVAFNAPFYAGAGFVVVDTPGGVLARHLDAERAFERLGPRVGMVRDLLTSR